MALASPRAVEYAVWSRGLVLRMGQHDREIYMRVGEGVLRRICGESGWFYGREFARLIESGAVRVAMLSLSK